MTEHTYNVNVEWTGNLGQGTSGYQTYKRDYTLSSGDKLPIFGSSDPAFLGDPKKWNPEDLLVASASACHKLWYLHLCAVNNIQVVSYFDSAQGSMIDQHPTKKGHFTEILLKPIIYITAQSDIKRAFQLHDDAHHECFIANSLNFPVRCTPTIYVSDEI